MFALIKTMSLVDKDVPVGNPGDGGWGCVFSLLDAEVLWEDGILPTGCLTTTGPTCPVFSSYIHLTLAKYNHSNVLLATAQLSEVAAV